MLIWLCEEVSFVYLYHHLEQKCFCLVFKDYLFIYLFIMREGKRGRRGGRETWMCERSY